MGQQAPPLLEGPIQCVIDDYLKDKAALWLGFGARRPNWYGVQSARRPYCRVSSSKHIGIETVTENSVQNIQCQGSAPVVQTATASAARGVGVAGIQHGVQNEPAQNNAPKNGVQIERHQHTSAETERRLRTQRRRYDRASKTRVEL